MVGTHEWFCSSCANGRQQAYRYPPSPDVYCEGCGAPVSELERLVQVVRVIADELREVTSPGLDDLAAKPLLTPPEAARVLGISVAALYARHARGQVPPAEKFGRNLRWRSSDLFTDKGAGRAPSPRRSRR